MKILGWHVSTFSNESLPNVATNFTFSPSKREILLFHACTWPLIACFASVCVPAARTALRVVKCIVKFY